MGEQYQIAVIGGGINGVGIAREAVSRGFKTLLLEKDDFGHCTSGNSSKLVHGGIRYLEQGEFRLVSEALKERANLLETAPHLAWHTRINIPVYKGQPRPAWLIRIGSFLYDMFAGERNLGKSRMLGSNEQQNYKSLRQKDLKGMVQYSDGQCLDSRLTLELALDAKSQGGVVCNHTELLRAHQEKHGYRLRLKDHRNSQEYEVYCDYLVNAAGPWVPILDQDISQERYRPHLKYVRGIHFVIEGRLEEEGFLVLPSDGRVIFVLPWVENTTLIGTTESEYSGSDFDNIEPSEEEIKYLLHHYNYFFEGHPIKREDILYQYAGVRSLLDSGDNSLSALTREYKIEEEWGQDKGYLAVFGGKITTYRALSQKVVDKIANHCKSQSPVKFCTQSTSIHGSRKADSQKESDIQKQVQNSRINPSLIDRWKRVYGSCWSLIAAYALQEEGNCIILIEPDYCKAELLYNMNDEMAWNEEDFILRRSKMIYRMDSEQRESFRQVLKELKPSGEHFDNTILHL